MSSKNAARLSLFCAVLAVLIWLWESDSALNAVVLFITAGEVPGTGVILTPGQMYIVMAVVLSLGIILLFGGAIANGMQYVRIFWRGGRVAARAYKEALHTPTSALTEASGMVIRPTAVVNVPALAIKHTKAAQSTAAAAHITKRQKSESAVVITIPGGPGHIALRWRRIRPVLIVATGRVLELIVRGMHTADIWMRRGIVLVQTYTVQAWRWTEPRIRVLDKNIEQAVKGNKQAAAVLRAGAVAAKTTRAYSTLVRTKMGQRLSRTPEE
jgi:hypothetical protein